MSIFSIFKGIRLLRRRKPHRNTEIRPQVSPGTNHSRKGLLPKAVAERVLAENRAEIAAKKAVQRNIDREVRVGRNIAN